MDKKTIYMYNHASVFKDATQDCFPGFDDNGGLPGFRPIPGVVLMAFTCEMYIKATLSALNIGFKKVHDLHSLFLLLPEKVKQEIISRHSELYTGAKNAISFEMFIIQLEDIKNAFQEWRYAYEFGVKGIDTKYFWLIILSLEEYFVKNFDIKQ